VTREAPGDDPGRMLFVWSAGEISDRTPQLPWPLDGAAGVDLRLASAGGPQSLDADLVGCDAGIHDRRGGGLSKAGGAADICQAKRGPEWDKIVSGDMAWRPAVATWHLAGVDDQSPS
jgi:hypothetical protein